MTTQGRNVWVTCAWTLMLAAEALAQTPRRAVAVSSPAAAQGSSAMQLTPVTITDGLTPLPVTVGGRVLNTPDEGDPSFGGTIYGYQWPGTHFEAAFDGTEVYFRLGLVSRQLLHVTVDDQVSQVLTFPPAGDYRISGLKAGPHRVRVEVVTESIGAISIFRGFAIKQDEHALPMPAAVRQMELVGDSHTVGYGDTSPVRECPGDGVLQATNVDLTAGVLTAQHYGADYQVVAISGRGVVRNYDGYLGDTMPEVYPYLLQDKAALYAPETVWQPQLVVVSLGTNDFSRPLHEGERWKTREELCADVESTYLQFVTMLRARYPDAFLILWSSDIAGPEAEAAVQNAAETLALNGEERVHFIPMKGLTFSACDWHPSLADNRLIYDKLVSFIDANPKIWQGR